MFSAAVDGLLLGGSLIVAIGAQNAFVLRQGLLRRHVLPVALVCALSDALLIAVGVFGLGLIAGTIEGFARIATVAGAIFLVVYGLLAARRAVHPHVLRAEGEAGGGLGRALLVCLGFTFLNPHVYLDTVLLVGSVGTRYPDGVRIAFAAGATLASFAWFFGLGYGARLLAPVFARPVAWRVLDGLIAVLMIALAAKLLFSANQ